MPQDRRLWVRPKSNPLEKAEDEPEDAPFPKQVSDPPLGGKPPCGTLFERASVGLLPFRRGGGNDGDQLVPTKPLSVALVGYRADELWQPVREHGCRNGRVRRCACLDD